jgi:hypothetical protein
MATKNGNAFVIIIEYHVPDDLACLVCCISSPAPEGGQLKFDEGEADHVISLKIRPQQPGRRL